MKILFALVFLFTSSTGFSQYTIDTSKSSIRWYGYYLFSFGEHFGSVDVKQSSINIKDGVIAAGNVVLDMNTITALDMPANDGGSSLSDHLKSADFFDVVKFPEAQFDIVSIPQSRMHRRAVQILMSLAPSH